MRILFSFAGGSGHLEPLVPIARAARAAGHTVAIAGRANLMGAVAAAGFDAYSTGGRLTDDDVRVELRPVDAEREDRDLREGFADRLARARATAVGELARTWRPDVLVCDETDFGAMIAAEVLGLPYASVVVIAAGSFVRPQVVGERLQEVRAAFGLAPDPELVMLRRHLVLAPVPASFRDPGWPLPPTAHVIRPDPSGLAGQAAAPPWAAELTGPTVYFTLGTVFNVESGDLFGRVLAGLRELPVNLVVTVGRQIDPAELGPQPPRVRVERFIPQAAILPYCAGVVSHGGSGSVLGALAHGLPMVLAPMGADQPHNAEQAERLGVARVLDVMTATPADARDAVAAVLGDPAYRERATRVREEIDGLPDAAYAVDLLTALV